MDKNEAHERFEDWLLFGCFWGVLLFGVFFTLQVRGCVETTYQPAKANQQIIKKAGINE